MHKRVGCGGFKIKILYQKLQTYCKDNGEMRVLNTLIFIMWTLPYTVFKIKTLQNVKMAYLYIFEV